MNVQEIMKKDVATCTPNDDVATEGSMEGFVDNQDWTEEKIDGGGHADTGEASTEVMTMTDANSKTPIDWRVLNI